MKKILVSFLISIIFFSLSSCANKTVVSKVTPYQDTRTPTSTTLAQKTKSLAPSPTPSITTLRSTDTSIIWTPSPMPTPTFTPLPVSNLFQNCLAIQQVLPEKHQFSRKIVLFSPSEYSISVYDLQTQEFTSVQGNFSFPLATSPDRMMFAYQDFKAKLLRVFSSDGKLIKELTWGEDWGRISKWIDNQRIALVTSVQENERNDKYPRDIAIVNVFTNELTALSSDYPDIDRSSNNLSWGYSGTTAYDPSLTRVIYPGGQSQDDYGYTLYGIPENKKLAQLPAGNFGIEPQWSPDGSQFLVMGNDEFYLVNRNGDMIKLINMIPAHTSKEGNPIYIFSRFYSWSPNGKNVALWLETIQKETPETSRSTLAILDTDTGEITDTCISAGYNPHDLFYFPSPIWSPDGNAVIVEANFDLEDNSRDVVLINLENYVAYKILNNYIPMGWLKGQ